MKHTCNGGNGPHFGRKTPGCPRCDELLAGAEPRTLGWVENAKRQAVYERQDRERTRLNIARGLCFCGKPRNHAIVCTAGDW